MKNQVIEVLDVEHGKKVIEYWKGMGVDTRGIRGVSTLEKEFIHRYYGVIDGIFWRYTLEEVTKANAEIIELPTDVQKAECVASMNETIEGKNELPKKSEKEISELFNKLFGTNIASRFRKMEEEFNEYKDAVRAAMPTFDDPKLMDAVVDELADLNAIVFHTSSILGVPQSYLLRIAEDKISGRQVDPNYKRAHPHIKPIVLDSEITFTPNEDIVFLTHEKERLEKELKEARDANQTLYAMNESLVFSNKKLSDDKDYWFNEFNKVQNRFDKYRNAIKSIVDYAE